MQYNTLGSREIDEVCEQLLCTWVQASETGVQGDEVPREQHQLDKTMQVFSLT